MINSNNAATRAPSQKNVCDNNGRAYCYKIFRLTEAQNSLLKMLPQKRGHFNSNRTNILSLVVFFLVYVLLLTVKISLHDKKTTITTEK